MELVYLQSPMLLLKRVFLSTAFFGSTIIIIPILSVFIYFSETGVGNLPSSELKAAKLIPAVKGDSTITITMSFVGDLMCHVPQMTNAKKSDGTYDFSPSFKEIKPFLSAADITIGNIECTFAGSSRAYNGYPAFNCPDEFLDAIKNSGIDFLCTSNNHSMDTGEEGLLRTIKKVSEKGFGYTGTFVSQRDRDSIRILNIKGIKIAVLNYTYGTNGSYPSAKNKWMLNVADSALVKSDVLRARKTSADLVLVFYHWGIENKQEPIAQQFSMFDWAADAGADLIIGAHPHVIEPIAFFKTAQNAKLDSGVVAWSLGNFISNQYWRYTDAGMILNLTIEKNKATGKLSLKKTSFVPTWVYRSYDASLKQHVIVPANWCNKDSLPLWINTESKQKMCEALNDTKKLIEKRGIKIDSQE